jgi:hypothetical protein
MKMIKEIPLGKEKEFELELPMGSVIRRWEMGVEEQKVLVGLQVPNLPPGQKVLREIPIIFVEMDPDAPVVKRTFKVVQTGEPLDDSYQYVSSVLARSPAGMFWFHLFEQSFPV